MNNRCLLVFVVLLNAYPLLYAQQKVSGKIYAATTDSVIKAVRIYNKNNGSSAYSAIDGSYSIAASQDDTIIFSNIGYTTDTVTVQFSMLLTQYDVTMRPKFVTLDLVKVTSNSYSQDSLNRRNYYQYIYKKQPGITGFNTPSYGFGIVLSPVSYLSREGRQKRALKKRLHKQEEDDYIDRSFPAALVGRVTGLKGDSLSLFMYGYRPSYAFCRKADRQQMLIYISTKLKEFRKPKRNT
jgi:hypothetical protein